MQILLRLLCLSESQASGTDICRAACGTSPEPASHICLHLNDPFMLQLYSDHRDVETLPPKQEYLKADCNSLRLQTHCCPLQATEPKINMNRSDEVLLIPLRGVIYKCILKS